MFKTFVSLLCGHAS